MVRATTTDIEKTVQDVTKNVFIRPPEVQKRYLNTPKPHDPSNPHFDLVEISEQRHLHWILFLDQ